MKTKSKHQYLHEVIYIYFFEYVLNKNSFEFASKIKCANKTIVEKLKIYIYKTYTELQRNKLLNHLKIIRIEDMG